MKEAQSREDAFAEQLALEEKWQAIWKEKKAFQAQADSSKEKFFGTVPYPYANSILHIGHGRAYTTPDIFIRFQRLLGKNVLYPMAFHITGTPVLAVADNIARGDEKQIKLTRDAIADYVPDKAEQDKLIASFKEPHNIASFFSKTIASAFDAVGISIDWRRQFTTGEPLYNKCIQWQYKKLEEAGILVQGKYPILYSAKDENAVGEDDIKDGDVDKVSIQEMTYMLFQRKTAQEYFVVATLRPDALFGTTNLWIHADMDIVKLEVNKQVWIVAQAAQEKIMHQFDEVKVISKHKGSEFVGETCITPLIDREIIVANATFLDPKHGTGLAYSSPAGSPHDYIALQEAKQEKRLPQELQVIVTVTTTDKKGNSIVYDEECGAAAKNKKFGVKSSKDHDALEKAKQELYKEEHYGGKLNDACGVFAGTPISVAKEKVKQVLIEKNLGNTLLETSRRAVTRGGSDVIVANLEGQWFLDYTKEEVKKKAYALLEQMSYAPAKLRNTQQGYLEWVSMRPCARKRGLGTPLPQDPEWIIEALSDSTMYQMYYLFMHVMTRENVPAEELTIAVLDYILLGKGDVKKLVTTKLTETLLEEMRKEVVYWKSFDYRYTAGAHMSNHLSFLIYHYSIIFEQEYWPKNITVGGMLIKDGEKISKSKGNGIPLSHVPKKYGADLYRLYIAVGASYDVEMDFVDEEIFQLEKKFRRFKELMVQAKTATKVSYDDFSDVSKWLISKFYSKVAQYKVAMNDMNIREAYIDVFYNFLNDIAYHERRTSTKQTYEALRFIYADYLLVMAPAIPHSCEELYEGESEKLISNEVLTTDVHKYIATEIEERESMVEELIASIGRQKEQQKLANVQEITLIQAPHEKFALFDDIKESLAKKIPPKELFSSLAKKYPSQATFIKRFVPKTLGTGVHTYLAKEKETKLLESLRSFIEKEFSATLHILDADTAKEVKGTPLPARPLVQTR